MYERGDVQYLTDLHSRHWPAWHKTGETDTTHRWLSNQLEKIMRSIDPQTTLPYWDSTVYGSQPERSSLWDVLGHSGNYSDGYCVGDGIYKDWNLIPCMKRHWSPRGTIYPWFTPEFVSAYLQLSSSFSDFDGFSNGGDHFPIHLNVGGYEGQYSVSTAPYE